MKKQSGAGAALAEGAAPFIRILDSLRGGASTVGRAASNVAGAFTKARPLPLAPNISNWVNHGGTHLAAGGSALALADLARMTYNDPSKMLSPGAQPDGTGAWLDRWTPLHPNIHADSMMEMPGSHIPGIVGGSVSGLANTAEKAVDTLAGKPDEATKEMDRERMLRLFGKFIGGGALLGGSAGLAQSLGNYMHSQRRDLDVQSQPSEDKDTLVVNVDDPDDQKKQAGLDTGLAFTGGALSALLANYLVRNQYSKFKKNMKDQRLQDSQQMFMNAQDAKMDEAKTAGDNYMTADGQPVGPWEAISGGVYAAPILTALASAVITNSALNRAFPVRKAPGSLSPTQAPKRIILRSRNTDPDESDTPGEVKEASELTDDGIEFAVRFILGLCKEAGRHEYEDVVCAIAQGREQEVMECFEEYKGDAFDFIKGASAEEIDPARRALAISVLCKSAFFRPVICDHYLRAELEDLAPSFVKMAINLTDGTQWPLAAYACYMGRRARYDDCKNLLGSLEKSCSSHPWREPFHEGTPVTKSQPSTRSLSKLLLKNEVDPSKKDKSMDILPKHDDIVDKLLA